MAKFRVGDGVRIIRSDYGAPPRLNGRQATIVEASGTSCAVSVPGEIHRWHYNENELELVTPAQPSELEQLVATANAGLAALHELREKHENLLEVSGWANSDDGKAPPTSGFVPITACGSGYYPNARGYFRIKQKPAFEPFTVGQGWRVELVGTDRVRVGCQEYGVPALSEALHALCKGTQSVACIAGTELHATRDGIRQGTSNNISWDDADKLLAALKKVEGK